MLHPGKARKSGPPIDPEMEGGDQGLESPFLLDILAPQGSQRAGFGRIACVQGSQVLATLSNPPGSDLEMSVGPSGNDDCVFVHPAHRRTLPIDRNCL